MKPLALSIRKRLRRFTVGQDILATTHEQFDFIVSCGLPKAVPTIRLMADS